MRYPVAPRVHVLIKQSLPLGLQPIHTSTDVRRIVKQFLGLCQSLCDTFLLGNLDELSEEKLRS
jgi:hypothetical protein